MSGESDLMKLYSQRILALAADIPHTGRLETPDASVKKRSPLCGSTVTVDVNMADGVVTDYAADIKACALGQASAGVVAQAAIGRTLPEIEKGRDQLKAMLKDGAAAPDAPFDGLEALTPAKEYKNRHASIMLAIEALFEAASEAAAKEHA